MSFNRTGDLLCLATQDSQVYLLDIRVLIVSYKPLIDCIEEGMTPGRVEYYIFRGAFPSPKKQERM